jgi:hypothetical protein
MQIVYRMQLMSKAKERGIKSGLPTYRITPPKTIY